MSKEVVIITGASRGIGLGLVNAFLKKSYLVAAVARNLSRAKKLRSLSEAKSERFLLLSFDVTDEPAIERARKEIEDKWGYADILINNAGIFGGKPQDSVRDLDYEIVKNTFDVNVLGPLRTARGFLPLLERGKEKKIIQITSQMGSIDDNSSGGEYAYRISKAALNMMNRNLSLELKEKGFCCVVMHPGWVRTDMGGKEAPLSVEESVEGMMNIIPKLKPKETGSFFSYKGSHLPW